MKKPSFHSFLLILLNMIIALSACQEVKDDMQPDKNYLYEKIQALADSVYDDYTAKYPEFPGGIGIRIIKSNDTGFFHKGFPDISEDYHFRGQSTTKTFTAAGIVLLHQQGLLHLESLVTDKIPGKDIPYLPGTENYNIPYKSKITIKQLLNHTAGVYDLINNMDGALFLDNILSQNPDSTVTIDLMTSFISINQKYEFEPGESWSYSNSGYQLLAKIIERVSGKSYRQFMEDAFVKPLQLNETSFPEKGTEQTIPEPCIESWAYLSDGNINLTVQNMSANVGEGNIITSPRDLCKFYHLLLNGKADINMSIINQYMTACVPTSPVSKTGYGMGLFHINDLGYGHGGDGSGISVKCYTDPANDFTVLVLTNGWNFINGTDDISLLEKQSSILQNLMYDVRKLVLAH